MRCRKLVSTLLIVGVAACAPAEHVRTTDSATVVVPGVARLSSAPADTVTTTGVKAPRYLLLVNVGPRAAAARVPELLAMTDGERRIGRDAAGTSASWPGAAYDSSRTVDDDDGSSAGTQAIDQRELSLPVSMRDSCILVVTGVARGRYTIMVDAGTIALERAQ